VPDEVREKIPGSYTNPYMKFEGGEEESLPAYNGVTGDIIFRMPHPGGRRVSRQELRKVLLEGVDVRWGKKLRDLAYGDDGVLLTFADGSTAEADFVVGADGASSMARRLLVGVDEGMPKLAGMTFATCIVKYGDAAKVEAVMKLHPVAAIIFCPDSIGGSGGRSLHVIHSHLFSMLTLTSVLKVDDPEDKSTWTMFWVKIWRGGATNLHGQECLDYIKETTKNSYEPFQSMIDWTNDGTQCDADEMKYWVPTAWDNHGGRATIIGDAAHPMLPCKLTFGIRKGVRIALCTNWSIRSRPGLAARHHRRRQLRQDHLGHDGFQGCAEERGDHDSFRSRDD